MADDNEQPVIVRFESDVELDVDWQVAGFRLSEGFNEPFELAVELYTTDLWGEPAQLLGANATLTLERGTITREVSGIIERIEDGAIQEGKLVTRLTIVPALRALGMRKTSRIFQEMTIPEILQEVLDEGLGPYERSIDTDHVSASYAAQEYTVQYQETDLQFVHRLMEEYGISYRFKSEDGREIMLLGDSESAWVDLVSLGNDAGVLPINLRDGGSGGREDVRRFQRTSKLRSTVARTMVFDWLAPDALIDAESTTTADVVIPNGAEHGPEREEYDHGEPSTTFGYRSEALVVAELEGQIALRRALHQRDAVRCLGASSATLLAPGCKFELLDHPQADLGAEYLVTEVIHSYGSYAGGEPGSDAYVNQFECIPAVVEWRPARRHPRPRITSVQTATVVGPAGDEIHTDEHGRIKVQFHWDRGGSFDENSSCFVRVVQPWAGNHWGFVWLPRIGMEVVVTFVDGDPDRPIVTGSLYNATHVPPYALPDEKTKSTIKSDSSPGGGGFNELRFEDAAGSEEIFIHAQKDFNEVVLNDMSTSVGHDQTLSVGNDRSKDVKGHETIAIHKDRVTDIDGSESVHIKGSLNMTIDGGANKGKAGDPTALGAGVAVTGEYNISATQKLTITVGASKVIMDTSNISIETSASMTLKVGGSSITLVPAQMDAKSATIVVAGGASTMKLDGKADIKGGSEVLVHQGGSFMKLDGAVSIKGSTAKLEGESEAELKGAPAKVTGGDVVIGGGAIGVTGTGDVTVTGSTILLNA
ncbi:type VI secretion system Vgr family protein [Nannocystaceae bacterium ST9]